MPLSMIAEKSSSVPKAFICDHGNLCSGYTRFPADIRQSQAVRYTAGKTACSKGAYTLAYYCQTDTED